MKTPTEAGLASLSFVVLTSAPAFAHPMQGVGDFYDGMLHPIITLETVLPLIAFSLLAGQQRREAAIALLPAFPIALIVGAWIATLGNIPSYVGIALLVQTAILGLLVAVSRPLSVWILVPLSAVLGISVGVTNTVEALAQVSTLRFVAGIVLTGFLLLVYGNGLVRNLKSNWTQIAIRVVGSWIAAISILDLGVK